MMRFKESTTGREIEVLLLLAANKNQTAEMVRRKLKKKVDRTSIWKTLRSLEKKELIGSDQIPPTREPSPRGGRNATKSYFILDNAYDNIYHELKKRGYDFVPVVVGKFIVSHPFPPNVDRRLPGEDFASYMMRTGFTDTNQARAFKDYFTDVRRATDNEVALYNILENCSGLVQEREESEREYKKYSKGYSMSPLCGPEEPK